MSNQHFDSVFRSPTILSCVQRSLEQSQKSSRAEPVHVVDFRQVTDHKVEGTTIFSQWEVNISFLEVLKKYITMHSYPDNAWEIRNSDFMKCSGESKGHKPFSCCFQGCMSFAESVEQNPAVHMHSLILLCTFYCFLINFCQQDPWQYHLTHSHTMTPFDAFGKEAF